MPYSSVLRRFWWVLVLGAAVAAVLGLVVYSTQKEDPVYSATARLLVTSAEAPYYRISVDRATQVPESGADAGTGSREVVQSVSPDITTLARAANLYPLLMVSDPVARLRTERFGDLPGELTAKAVFAVDTPSRFQPSDVPVIELTATSGTPGGAIDLAAATSKTFITWLGLQQDEANVGRRERIDVQELSMPAEAVASGGTSMSLPILVTALVFVGFAVLAAVFDRAVPPRRRPGRASADGAALEVHRGPFDRPDEAEADTREASAAARKRSGRGFGRRSTEAPVEAPVELDGAERIARANDRPVGAAGGAKGSAKPNRIG